MVRKLTVAVMVLFTTLALGATSAGAISDTGSADTPTPPVDVPRVPGANQRYLDAIDKPDVETVGEAECGKAIADRQGRWMCLGLPPQAGGPNNLRSNLLSACSIEGCWDVTDSTHATWFGGGYYGINDKQLGELDLDFRVSLVGYRTDSYPFRFESTRSVKALKLTGERLYISSAYPGGNSISGGATLRTKLIGDVPWNTRKTWPWPGYRSYENTARRISVVHMYEWRDITYSGTWWVWAKSNIAEWRDVGYRFPIDDDNYPYNKSDAGWSP